MSDLPDQAEALLSFLRKAAPKRYILRWVGSSRVPRGAKIGEVAIGWTQHGIVTGTGGEQLGYYERTVEWGGPYSDSHEMIISCAGPVYGPNGDLCPEVEA